MARIFSNGLQKIWIGRANSTQSNRRKCNRQSFKDRHLEPAPRHALGVIPERTLREFTILFMAQLTGLFSDYFQVVCMCDTK